MVCLQKTFIPTITPVRFLGLSTCSVSALYFQFYLLDNNSQIFVQSPASAVATDPLPLTVIMKTTLGYPLYDTTHSSSQILLISAQ